MADPTTTIPVSTHQANDPTLVALQCAATRTASRRLRVAAPVLLILLLFIAFLPALDAGLVNWDDDDLLLVETRYRALTPESMRWMFTTSYTGHFQPLTWLSYSLDWALWHRETAGQHLVSLMLHGLTAILFYFVTRRLLVWGLGPPYSLKSTPVVVASWFAATLFACHPLRVESVVWLAERRDVLSGVFYLASLASYLRYASTRLDNPPPFRSSSPPKYYLLAVLLCAVSLLAKASAVTLPAVLIILEIYPLRRWTLSSLRRARVWIDKIPFLILALLGGVRAVIAQQEGGALQTLAQHDLLARSAQACYGLVFYIWKTLIPANLSPLYEIPGRDVSPSPMSWVSPALVGGLAILAFRARRRFPAIPAALAAYAVIVFPVLGFAQSGPQLVADRYSYLSCMGFAVLAGAGLVQLLRHPIWRKSANVRAITALAGVILITQSVRATFRQSDVWLSPKTLWSHAVKVHPDSPIARTNLADAFLLEENPQAAYEQYQIALKLNPDDPVANQRIADLYASIGQRDAAVRHYLRSLRVDPNRERACFSLARLLVDMGRANQAVLVLEDGIKRHPDALDMIAYLAELLSTYPDESVRNGPEAVRLARRINRDPDHDTARNMLTLATAYAEAGRFEEAVATAERALSMTKGRPRLAAELERRLERFRRGKPYHDGE